MTLALSPTLNRVSRWLSTYKPPPSGIYYFPGIVVPLMDHYFTEFSGTPELDFFHALALLDNGCGLALLTSHARSMDYLSHELPDMWHHDPSMCKSFLGCALAHEAFAPRLQHGVLLQAVLQARAPELLDVLCTSRHLLYSMAGDRRCRGLFWGAVVDGILASGRGSQPMPHVVTLMATEDHEAFGYYLGRHLGTWRRKAAVVDALGADHLLSGVLSSSSSSALPPPVELMGDDGSSSSKSFELPVDFDASRHKYEHIVENAGLSTRIATESKMEENGCSCHLYRRAPESVTAVNCRSGETCESAAVFAECTHHTCANQRLQKRLYPRFEIYDTRSAKGHGARALEAIRRGALIVEYVGHVKRVDGFRRDQQRVYAPLGYGQYAMAVRGGLVIDATVRANWARFLNHSCAPNCRTQLWTVRGAYRVGIFAMRDIQPGEELCYDYQFEWFAAPENEDGEGDEEAVDGSREVCSCGAPNCRGLIGKKAAAAAAAESERAPTRTKAAAGVKVKRVKRQTQTKITDSMVQVKKQRRTASLNNNK